MDIGFFKKSTKKDVFTAPSKKELDYRFKNQPKRTLEKSKLDKYLNTTLLNAIMDIEYENIKEFLLSGRITSFISKPITKLSINEKIQKILTLWEYLHTYIDRGKLSLNSPKE